LTTGSTGSTGDATTGLSITTGPSETYATFFTIEPETGFAGIYIPDGYSTDIAKVGDKGLYQTDSYRTILSFDTSGLLVNKNVTAAALRIYRKSLTGKIQYLTVDIKAGSFGGSSKLTQSDYNAPASASSICTMTIPPGDNTFSETQLPYSALKWIHYENDNGRTQFRIRATTTAGLSPNLLTIYGAEGDSNQYTASLLVTYN